MQAPLSLQDAIKRRQIGAASGTAVAPLMFQGAQFAGAGNVGSALTGQALGQFGNTIANLGGMALGNYMQGYGYGQAKGGFGSMSFAPELQMPTIGSSYATQTPSNWNVGANTPSLSSVLGM
jgi:hypothetical protein